MGHLLITEQLEVSPETSEASIVKVLLGEVVKTLVPVVQLWEIPDNQLDRPTAAKGYAPRLSRFRARLMIS